VHPFWNKSNPIFYATQINLHPNSLHLHKQHTTTYHIAATLSNCRNTAISKLRSKKLVNGTKESRISKIRTLLPRSSGSHCLGQHTSGCPFCTHVSPGFQDLGAVRTSSKSLKNTTSMFVTLLSPSGGHSWLTHGSICNQKHKALPNEIIISAHLPNTTKAVPKP